MNEHAAFGAIVGALVADAAALGLHWIYDTDRIAAVVEAHGGSAFVPIDPAHYADVPAYFAHGLRTDGASSQYGECLRLAVDFMHTNGGAFDMAAYQTRFAAHFGMGGTYIGYIDRPTRAAVAHIEGEQLTPSGSDDDQLPALATLPALVASKAAMDDVDAAISVTHVNEAATGYGGMFAGLLADVIAGAEVRGALEAAARAAEGEMGELLSAALRAEEQGSVAYGETTGRACHLHQGLPLAFHILARSESFAEAVERNILAGGDSCGRAIAIGAVMGARYGADGIPEDWISQVSDTNGILAKARELCVAAKSQH